VAEWSSELARGFRADGRRFESRPRLDCDGHFVRPWQMRLNPVGALQIIIRLGWSAVFQLKLK